MSDTVIFFAGLFVTLIWFSVVGVLVWAAYQDGKREAKSQRNQS